MKCSTDPFLTGEMGLSIAVAAKGDCQPQGFMEALAAENVFGADDMDVHIAHNKAWPEQTVQLAPNVYLHPCAEGTSILKLWGIAISRSTRDFIAILDIHCPPKPGWLKRVRTEIEQGMRLFFGPVDPGWALEDVRIVGYLTEYAQFRSPLADEINEVPGNNLVCHRSLLESPESLEQAGFFKTFMIWKLAREAGLQPACFNDMAVSYLKPFRLGHYLARRYTHGRCFGGTRLNNPHQPPRWVCLSFAPLLPALRTWRSYKVARQRNDLRKSFFRFLPLILLSESAWSLGELLGYAMGARGACDRLD